MITIIFNNEQIYHGRIFIPDRGWVSSVDGFINYIGDKKFIMDENNWNYHISTIFKMKDMSMEEMRDYKIEKTLENQ